MRYCVNIKGSRVRVSRYEDETDYGEQVRHTFAKFAGNAAKDYRTGFRNMAEMDHVEERILDLVARLYPDEFGQLDDFCTRHDGYTDETIRVFEREVQFYLAYQDFTAPMRADGLEFCYPAVSGDSRQTRVSRAFDLALATKLMPRASEVVRNDFGFDGPERIFVVTGPNHGGKTTFARTFGQLHYLASLDLTVPAGFTRFFAMLSAELDDTYLAEVEAQIGELEFRHGTLMSARPGSGNKGAGYVLRWHPEQGWRDRISGLNKRSAYTFTVPERDENGLMALSELTNRAHNSASNALAQSVDHIRAFFGLLRAELGFYLGCLNLRDRLEQAGAPVCFPVPGSPVLDHANHLGLSVRGLYDASLTLNLSDQAVGNDVDADGKQLIMITGANQGGKSTFLRSVGLAQLMTQTGMFVAAQSYAASVSTGIFTHFKREEDATMEMGKLDEELDRMSRITDQLRPGSR